MVSANEVPFAIQHAGEQLARKNRRVEESVDVDKQLPNLEIEPQTPTLGWRHKSSTLPSTGWQISGNTTKYRKCNSVA